MLDLARGRTVKVGLDAQDVHRPAYRTLCLAGVAGCEPSFGERSKARQQSRTRILKRRSENRNRPLEASPTRGACQGAG